MLFARNLKIGIVSGLCLVCACAGSKVTTPPAPVESTAAVSTSRVYSVLDEDLADLIVQFLATSKAADPRIYEQRRRLVQTRLADYLAANDLRETSTLEVRREGMTFLLPLKLVTADAPARSKPFDTFTINQPSIANFSGEIVDLAWISGKLAGLFPDSVALLPLSNQQKLSKVARFEPRGERSRPMHAAGFLAPRGGTSLVIQSSNLDAPLFFETQAGRVREIRSTDLASVAEDPTSWLFQKGSTLLQSRRGQLGTFRSLRALSDGKLVLLDPDGYLKLLDEKHQTLWISERPWGDRLFLLDEDILAVCHSWERAFVAFQSTSTGLELLGQSPAFKGLISAVAVGEHNGRRGVFVAARSTELLDEPATQLYFLQPDELHWLVPATLPEPRFPDLDRELTLVLENDAFSGSLPTQTAVPEELQANLYETLYRVDDQRQLRPLLVQTAETDKAAQVWRLHLKQNVRFSDGTLLTANNIKDSWKSNWLSCHKKRCSSIWLWENVKGAREYVEGKLSEITGLEPLDKFTLQVTLTAPRPHFREHLTQACFAVTKPELRSPTLLGTGPYKVELLDPDNGAQAIVLGRNKSYHGGHPLLKQIAVKFGDPADAVLGEATAGAVVRSPRDLEFLKELESLSLGPFPERQVYFFALNPFKAPLSNETQRRRLVTAMIERQLLANIVTRAECSATNSLLGLQDLPPSHPVSNAQPQLDRPLSVAYLTQDAVAAQIAERIIARLSQNSAFDHVKLPLTPDEFESFRRGSTYDILVDSFRARFSSAICDLAQLAHRGYPLPAALLEQLSQALTSSDSEQSALQIERQLVDQAILYPVLATQAYSAMPASLHDLQLAGAAELLFSKAWLPAR